MSLLLYRTFLWLYKLGANLLSPFNEKARYWVRGRRTVFSELSAFFEKEKRPVIWFHCASLGEFEQARPLLEEIRTSYPGYCILLSFFSPSGYRIRKNYEQADFVCYLPMDSAGNASRFLDLAHPALVFWVKYEYWHFYLRTIRERRIPLLLVSGIFREDQAFFRAWGSLHRRMLDNFTAFFVQNSDSSRLLGSIGISRDVIVSGDTRFDRVIEIAAQPASFPELESFLGNRTVIVAGSTWEEDEEELDHYANTNPALRFIIAPHEIDEDHLLDIEKLFRKSIRYSQLTANKQIPADVNVLILDTMGMLASVYRYARIAYIGGGFGEDGVHNVLEAAVYGIPVVFGPEYEKFAEAVGLVDAGAGFSIDNALELESELTRLLNNREDYTLAAEAAVKFVKDNAGATNVVLRYIQENRLLTS